MFNQHKHLDKGNLRTQKQHLEKQEIELRNAVERVRQQQEELETTKFKLKTERMSLDIKIDENRQHLNEVKYKLDLLEYVADEELSVLLKQALPSNLQHLQVESLVKMDHSECRINFRNFNNSSEIVAFINTFNVKHEARLYLHGTWTQLTIVLDLNNRSQLIDAIKRSRGVPTTSRKMRFGS